MDYRRNIAWILMMAIVFLAACDRVDPDPDPDPIPEPEKPLAVQKTNPMKIYMHYMPWFETPESNNGNWGLHWTMANKDPEVIVDGKREIASHYYPLIGPYASGNEAVIEYHLLLMKYAGVDGVIIDWYGSYDLLDYDDNRDNSEALIGMLDDVGLGFSIMYEDRTLEKVVAQGLASTYADGAARDMQYMAENYFDLDSYEWINDGPLLTVFGPVLMQDGDDWSTALAAIEESPSLLSLWYESGDMTPNASGEFAWVYMNNSRLQDFYDTRATSLDLVMGGAYPGFHDAYGEGGWGESYPWTIDHLDGATFQTCLNMARDAGMEHLQLITWNDFGEGTMIEPTLEFGYSFLEILQGFTGVQYTADELELIHQQYELRTSNPGNRSLQQALDMSFGKFISLKKDEAKAIIDSLLILY